MQTKQHMEFTKPHPNNSNKGSKRTKDKENFCAQNIPISQIEMKREKKVNRKLEKRIDL